MEVIRLLQMSDIHWTRQLDSTDDYTDIREMMLEDLGYYRVVAKPWGMIRNVSLNYCLEWNTINFIASCVIM